MSSATSPITEGEILSHAIDAIEEGEWKQIALVVRHLKLPQKDLDRVDALLKLNRTGKIKSSETVELEKYLRVGNFLDLVRARALRELHSSAGNRR